MLKPIVILLPGWGMPSTLWEGVCQRLHAHLLTRMIELPHGPSLSLTGSVQMITEQLPDEPCLLVGWSLGGALASLVAQQADDRVQGVITLGTNVAFVASDVWPHGMPVTLWNEFTQMMRNQPKRTWQRFLYLCAQGSKTPQKTLKRLQQQAPYQSDFNYQCGLNWLAEIHLATQWTRQDKSWHLFACEDALVPVASDLAAYPVVPHRIHMGNGGHSLPIDQPDWVADKIVQYYQQSRITHL